MSKSVTGKIWSSIISKLALAGLVFAFFYIIGDSFHIIPQSVKDFISFLAGNIQLFAFLFCFTIGSHIFIQILKTKRGEPR